VKQGFERVEKAPRLYRRTYKTADGTESVLFYARFVCKLKGRRRLFALGGDLKTAKQEMKVLDARNIRREDFDADKPKAKQAATLPPEVMTVERWSGIYLAMEETQAKRSYARDCELVATVNRVLGSVSLTSLKREHLFTYRKQRLKEHVIRAGKETAKFISQGTVANELSCLRHMLKKAHEEDIGVSVPSFKGLIVRSQRDRVLDHAEEQALLDAYPTWVRRVAVFAAETCLSQGDIVRLTKDMIDRKRREVVPTNGRVKTGVEQRAPLTDRALEVLNEIERERRAGRIVTNVNGLIFTRDDGTAINKDMITGAIKTGRRRADVKDFRFHDYRHVAQTPWARQGIHVDVAMKAAGHKSVAMHQRYVNLKPGDVAAAFGLENGNMDGRQNESKKEPVNVSA
jgi:integrase